MSRVEVRPTEVTPDADGDNPAYQGSVVTSLRIFFVGGLISFRALFNWLSPWIYVPSLLVAPIFQILLFAYLGRSAGVGSDEFYLIGNAVQYSAIPCIFAMANTIAGERNTQTLGIVLSTPAPRVPLFLGRSLPVVVNGWFVSMFSLLVGARLLGVDIPPSSWLPMALVIAVASASCTGLGLVAAALGLRVRETAVLSNVMFGILLLFSGANVAVDALPEWMASVSPWLPLSHAIDACRQLAQGAPLTSLGSVVLREALLAVTYAAAGLVALRLLEVESRRRATLERQ
jgi:ABC-2 type transport system permease protein